MGRAPCCDKANVKKGPWSPAEDAKLKDYIDRHGTGGNWIALPHKIGLKRCGKSCRLRWLNYLRPDIKHGEFSDEEDKIICSLYVNIGSRWSIIAAQLPGRTDNDIKNYWNTKLKKKYLCKQRKENLARRVKMQEMRKESENNFMVIPPGVLNETPYLPELPMPMFTNDVFQYPFDISFSQTSMDGNIFQWPNTHLEFNRVDDQNLFFGRGNFEVELSEMGYGNPTTFYGAASSSSEGSNWGDTTSSSLVYPSIASNYEVCQEGILQGSSFIQSKYFGLQ